MQLWLPFGELAKPNGNEKGPFGMATAGENALLRRSGKGRMMAAWSLLRRLNFCSRNNWS